MSWVAGRKCPWAVAHPEANRGHDVCIGWSCDLFDGGKKCDRKRGATNRRKAEASAYRKFPGRSDVPPPGPGLCSWCRQPVAKGIRGAKRGWHDGRGDEPDCLAEYYRHTRQDEQLRHLIRRDGPCCAGCGALVGRWFRESRPSDPEKLRSWGAAWARAYPADIYVAELSFIGWSSSLQVDHRLALGVVVQTIPEPERWRYWGPMNLQALCHDCHVRKTKADTAEIRRLRKLAAENDNQPAPGERAA